MGLETMAALAATIQQAAAAAAAKVVAVAANPAVQATTAAATAQRVGAGIAQSGGTEAEAVKAGAEVGAQAVEQAQPPAPVGGATPPSALPDVGLGKPAAQQPVPRPRSSLFERVVATGKTVAKSPTAQKVGLGGVSMLASKALAGDTSPAAAPRPPSTTDGAAAAAAAAERERRRQAGAGRASTILTSPLGISRPASVGAKVLLGA